MTTDIDIINRALAQAEARSQITSLQERTNEALYARLFYDETRRSMLRAAHWNFCEKTDYLELQKAAPGTPENTASQSQWTTADPAPPWLYQYGYPEDCLQMRIIVPMWPLASDTGVPGATPAIYPWGMAPAQGQTMPYRVVQGTLPEPDEDTIVTCIVTNQPSAIGKWTVDVEDVDRWDPSFTEAMTSALASRFAIPISGSKTLWKAKAQAAFAIVQQARERDGNEGTTQDDHVPEWLTARGIQPLSQPGYWASGWFTPTFLILG